MEKRQEIPKGKREGQPLVDTGNYFPPTWLQGVFLGASALLITATAWFSNGAAIQLREALNISNGWGLTFNINETQTLPSAPLWGLIWAALGQITGEWITTAVALNIILSVVALGIIYFRCASITALIYATCVLLLSNSFLVFTTSGLHLSLTFALTGTLFVVAYVSTASKNPTTITAGLLAGLLVLLFLTSPPAALALTPAFIYSVFKNRKVYGFAYSSLGIVVVAALTWGAWTVNREATGTLISNVVFNMENASQNIAQIAAHDIVTVATLLLSSAALLLKGKGLHRSVVAGVLVASTLTAFMTQPVTWATILASCLYLTVLATIDRFFFTTPKETKPKTVFITVTLLLVGTAAAVGLYQNEAITRKHTTAQEGVVLSTQTWGQAKHNNWTLLEAFTTSDTQTQFMPFQSPQVMIERQEPVPLASLRQAAQMWPSKTSTTPEADQEEFRSRCGTLGANSILTGPYVSWHETCIDTQTQER